MGYSKFSSYSLIIDYNYKSRSEVNEALGALEAMYADGNISKYQYDSAKALLESKLRSL